MAFDLDDSTVEDFLAAIQTGAEDFDSRFVIQANDHETNVFKCTIYRGDSRYSAASTTIEAAMVAAITALNTALDAAQTASTTAASGYDAKSDAIDTLLT